MDTRVRTALRTMRAPALPKHDKERDKRPEMLGKGPMNVGKVLNRRQSRREMKIALQQDVDKLKKKLRHEENVHRALERAFTRPLGALPRLPPYLPSNTLELLAEVAVLEEEVVRLEEQVMNFRQGLYQEAVFVSSSRKSKESPSDLQCDRSPYSKIFEQSKLCSPSTNVDTSIISIPSPSFPWPSDLDRNGPSSNPSSNGKRQFKKPDSRPSFPENQCGKENQLNTIFTRNNKQSPIKKVPRIRMPMETEKQQDDQLQYLATNNERVEDNFHGNSEAVGSGSDPNILSEDILKCLVSIFSRMNLPKNTIELATSPSVSDSCGNSEDLGLRDPYGICLEYERRRDVGPYKSLFAIDASSIDLNLVTRSPFLTRRLKLLIRKLAFVELSALTHQQKLAFWINIYNSCMMNAFLDQGIPASPQMVVAMMAKAIINVGGHFLSAMAIEHFILRLPYHSKHTYLKGPRNDEIEKWGMLGLECPEPLVTFALSCGSWSSPAVRVYTASQVESELETSKRDYLQAAVGIGTKNGIAIPKLLDWYLLDFAKDLESLMDWISLQLPSDLRDDVVKRLEMGQKSAVPQPVQVMPYEFRFRYLLAA